MDFSPRSHRRSAWPPGTVSRGPGGGGVPREGLAPQLSLLPSPTRGLTMPGLPRRCVTPLPAPFPRPEPLPRVCGKRARTPDPHRGHRRPQHPAGPTGQQDTVHWGQVWGLAGRVCRVWGAGGSCLEVLYDGACCLECVSLGWHFKGC